MRTPRLAIILALSPFLAFGQISFDSPVVAPGYGSPKSMAVGDFDGNGLEDVIVNSMPTSLLKAVYTNTGGTHTKKDLNITNPLGSVATMVVGDLNKDGKDDLVILQEASPIMKVCISNGTGFDVTSITLGASTQKPKNAVVDYNGDGNPDIVVAGKDTFVEVYTGDGTGNFTQSVLPVKPAFDGIDLDFHVADLNGDNKKDFVFVSDHTVTTYVSNGSAFIKETKTILGDLFRRYDQSRNSVIADLDGNGTLDVIAVTSISSPGVNATSKVSFLANNGSGSLADAVLISLDVKFISAIDCGDFDNDGKNDLIFGTQTEMYNNLVVLRNLGNLQFQNKTPNVPYWLSPAGVRFTNYDGTGSREIVYLSPNRTLTWFKWSGSTWSVVDEVISSGAPYYADVFDIDNDGFKDIIGNAGSVPGIEILYGKGNLQYDDPVFLPIKNYIWTVAAGDLNNDGYGDIIYNEVYLGAPSEPQPRGTAIMLSSGPRTFHPAFSATSTVTPTLTLVVRDLDNDGDLDIFDGASVALNDGTGHFTSTLIVDGPFDELTRSLDAGQFNDDTFLDLVLSKEHDLYIFFNDGTGHFSNVVKNDAVADFQAIRAIDVNGDGLSEIVGVENQFDQALMQTAHLYVLNSNGDGHFTPSFHVQPFPLNYYFADVDVADLDKNGLMDIVVSMSYAGFPTKPIIYKGLPNGEFDEPLQHPFETEPANLVPISPSSFTLADVDDDSKLDIVALFSSEVPVLIYRNASITPSITAPTNLEVDAVNTQANISLTRGNGTGRIILLRKLGDAAAVPADGQFYPANNTFQNGSKIGDNWVVMRDNRESITVKGLEPNQEYVVSVFEYYSNGNSLIDYMSTGPSKTFKTRMAQTISLQNTTGLVLDGDNIVVTASASSELPVELSLISGNGTVLDNTFTPVEAGKIKLHAKQSGNADYAAIETDFTFCVGPVKPIITISGSGLVVLTSNSDNHNTWYLGSSSAEVGSGKTFTPIADGFYKVAADIDGCASSLSEATELIVVGPESKVSEMSVSPTEITASVSFMKGQGDGRLITIRKATDNLVAPTNGVFYQSSDAFTTEFEEETISGLIASTDYIVTVYEYFTDGSTIINYSSVGVSKSFRTADKRIISFSNTSNITLGTDDIIVTASSDDESSVELSLISGNGDIVDNNFFATTAGPVTMLAKLQGNSEYSEVETEITFCVNPLKPTITVSGDRLKTLISSSDDNNTWFKENVVATGKTFIPIEDGAYYVKTSVGGCSTASDPSDDLVVGPTSTSTNLKIKPEETSVTISFNKGDGDGRLIILSKLHDPSFNPVNGTVYQTTTMFGTELESVTINGLSLSTDYIVTIVEYYSLPSKNIINYSKFFSVLDFRTASRQTISFSNTSNIVEGEGRNVTASSSSGLPVKVSILSGNGNVDGNKFIPTNPGVVRIQGTAPASDDYTAGLAVTEFCVYPAAPIITLAQNPTPVFTSSSDMNITWYLDNAVIPEATGKTFAPTKGGSYKVSVNVGGCANVSESIVYVIAGMEDELAKLVSLYPNPAKDILRISLPDGIKGEPIFFNTIGQQFNLSSKMIDKSLEVDVSQLPSGFYIAKIQNLSLKFIKQ